MSNILPKTIKYKCKQSTHTVQYDWTSCYLDDEWWWTLALSTGWEARWSAWRRTDLAVHDTSGTGKLGWTGLLGYFVWKNTQLALDFHCFWNIKKIRDITQQKSFSFKLYFWLNIIPFNIFSKNFCHLQSVKHSTETVSHNILLWLFDINVSRAHTVQNDWTWCYFLPCLKSEWWWTLALNTGWEARWSAWRRTDLASGWTPRTSGTGKYGWTGFYLDIYMKKYSVSFRLSLFLKHKENQRHNATKEFQF